MSEETKSTKRKFTLQPSDKILLGIVGGMMLVSVALSIMQRFGLSPVNATVGLYLPLLAVTALLAWGIVLLRRAIKRPVLRNVISWSLAALLLFAFARVMTYANYAATVSLPHRYSVITSPSGARKLVILRTMDSDEARYDERRAARLAADPDSGEDFVAEDMGYVYSAYPPALFGMFYRSDADLEGEVHLAYAGSTGVMMVEWLEDEAAAHFYVQDPGVAEGGEMTVRF